MPQEVSIRELRKQHRGVVVAVQAGEDIVLTAILRLIADIIPHMTRRSSWLPGLRTSREIVNEAPADQALLDDIADVRQVLVHRYEPSDSCRFGLVVISGVFLE
jgi:antitoxin (DNA-binding transcriptional repressor) of toxin-antitoxin stability system